MNFDCQNRNYFFCKPFINKIVSLLRCYAAMPGTSSKLPTFGGNLSVPSRLDR